VDGAALTDHGHLYLARILEPILDLARDLVGEQRRLVVVDGTRADDHPDLASRLQGIDLVHTGLRGSELLERLQTLDILLETLAPRARPAGRDGIGRDQENRFD